MKNKFRFVLITTLVFTSSACFTPTLRTGEIPISGPTFNTSIGFQFPAQKDPFVEGAPIDRIPHIFSSFLQGFGFEFGTTFFGNEEGLACSLAFVFAFIQQDIHPRCGIFQQNQGAPLSLAIGYKFSMNLLSPFSDDSVSPVSKQFINGNVVTLDLNAWIGDTFSPLLNFEIGKTLIPDKISVQQKLDRNRNPYSASEAVFIDAWTLKSTIGLGFRWVENPDSTVPKYFKILFGVTPIFKLDSPAFQGFETAVLFQFE